MAAKTVQPVSPALETRAALPTREVAYHLSRAPQTLRMWAMGSGPLQPRRIKGRLAWSVSEIKSLLGLSA